MKTKKQRLKNIKPQTEIFGFLVWNMASCAPQLKRLASQSKQFGTHFHQIRGTILPLRLRTGKGRKRRIMF